MLSFSIVFSFGVQKHSLHSKRSVYFFIEKTILRSQLTWIILHEYTPEFTTYILVYRMLQDMFIVFFMGTLSLSIHVHISGSWKPSIIPAHSALSLFYHPVEANRATIFLSPVSELFIYLVG